MVFYVYLYRDPRNNQPFYVGKGHGNRDRCHLRETAETTENRRKHQIICDIRAEGLEPIIERVAENLTEDAAYRLEDETIMLYGRSGIEENGILTNRNRGSATTGPILASIISKEDLEAVQNRTADIKAIAKKYNVTLRTVYNLRPSKFRKLTDEDRNAIRSSKLSSIKAIAEDLGFSQEVVRRIRGRIADRQGRPMM